MRFSGRKFRIFSKKFGIFKIEILDVIAINVPTNLRNFLSFNVTFQIRVDLKSFFGIFVIVDIIGDIVVDIRENVDVSSE